MVCECFSLFSSSSSSSTSSLPPLSFSFFSVFSSRTVHVCLFRQRRPRHRSMLTYVILQLCRQQKCFNLYRSISSGFLHCLHNNANRFTRCLRLKNYCLAQAHFTCVSVVLFLSVFSLSSGAFSPTIRI